MPSGFWVTAGCCLLLGMVAWVLAWRAVRRSSKANDLEVFIAFPFTHPFFMPLFIWRDWREARRSVVLYLSLILVWCVGGVLTQHQEQTKLDRLLAEMEKQGESLQYPSTGETFDDNDPDNIW